MNRHWFGVALAGMLSGISAVSCRAEGQPSEVSPDELSLTLDDRASEAGASAGIAEACGIYAAPVATAFNSMLDTLHVDPAERAALWRRYQDSESSALEAYAKEGSKRCADATGTILCTVHDLSRPLSGDVPTETGPIAGERSQSPGFTTLEPGDHGTTLCPRA